MPHGPVNEPSFAVKSFPWRLRDARVPGKDAQLCVPAIRMASILFAYRRKFQIRSTLIRAALTDLKYNEIVVVAEIDRKHADEQLTDSHIESYSGQANRNLAESDASSNLSELRLVFRRLLRGMGP